MRFAAVLVLCLCSLAANAQKWRLGQPPPHAQTGVDYPIKAHVSGIRLRNYYVGYGQFEDVIYADAIMSGRKVELSFNPKYDPDYYMNVLPGDYPARLLKASPKKNPYKTKDPLIDQKYELVLPDQTLLWATVTGIFE